MLLCISSGESAYNKLIAWTIKDAMLEDDRTCYRRLAEPSKAEIETTATTAFGFNFEVGSMLHEMHEMNELRTRSYGDYLDLFYSILIHYPSYCSMLFRIGFSDTSYCTVATRTSSSLGRT